MTTRIQDSVRSIRSKLSKLRQTTQEADHKPHGLNPTFELETAKSSIPANLSDEQLQKNVQRLPQELQDELFGIWMSQPIKTYVTINKSLKPPAQTQISRRTRALAIDFYYGTCIFTPDFECATERDKYKMIARWFMSLSIYAHKVCREVQLGDSVQFYPGIAMNGLKATLQLLGEEWKEMRRWNEHGHRCNCALARLKKVMTIVVYAPREGFTVPSRPLTLCHLACGMGKSCTLPGLPQYSCSHCHQLISDSMKLLHGHVPAPFRDPEESTHYRLSSIERSSYFNHRESTERNVLTNAPEATKIFQPNCVSRPAVPPHYGKGVLIYVGPPGYGKPVFNDAHFSPSSVRALGHCRQTAGMAGHWNQWKPRFECIEANRDKLTKDYMSCVEGCKSLKGWEDLDGACVACKTHYPRQESDDADGDRKQRECFIFVDTGRVWYKHNSRSCN